jgi:hypothetical protein
MGASSAAPTVDLVVVPPVTVLAKVLAAIHMGKYGQMGTCMAVRFANG